MRTVAVLAAAVLGAAPVAAQDAASLADRFEYALVAGDYRMLPLAEDFRYVENGAELEPWDGMWRTLTALEGNALFPALDYRTGLAEGGTIVRLVEFEENTVRGVLAYRLVARGGRIASVELLPVREEYAGDRGGTITLLQPMLPVTLEGPLVGAAGPSLGAADAARMAEAVTAYVEAMTADAPAQRAAHLERLSFTADCVRIDNGQQVTGRADAPLLDPALPSFRPFALGCAEQVRSGFYANYERGALSIHADPASGTAIAFVRLDQPGTLLAFEAPGHGMVRYPGPRGAVAGASAAEQFDGRILTNMITPMSVNAAFVFRFDEGAAIGRIEAFYRGAPLGWTAMAAR